MPLYEYECTQCKRHTEKIQKFSDPEITACPHCGGLLSRVVSAPAISFKGGGWYADGYGNAKPGSKSESKSESGTSISASSDGSGSSGKETSAKPASTESSSTPAPAAAAPAASSSDTK